MIGVIADDFTGAAEIGAVGLRHGLRAEVVMGGLPGGSAELVCLDTDSRSCTAEEAGRRAAEAAKRLVDARASWIYKKTDSVLRGPVAAELTALLRQLKQRRALLVPANPSLGRVIHKGRYFIHGTPVCETEFARDPEHPRVSSCILDLLGNAKGISIRICRACDALPSSAIVVGEVATAADLAEWATHRSADTLTAGGAEFFGALLKASGLTAKPAEAGTPAHATKRRRQNFATGEAKFRRTRCLFVCGTASEAGRAFILRNRQAGVPVFSLPESLANGCAPEELELDSIARRATAALEASGRALLCVGLPPVSDRTMARGLAVHLVGLAARVLRRAEVGRIYAEGGATAVQLVRRMGWSRLSVQRELSPGVVALGVEGGRTLTVKPGSYSWPGEVLDGTLGG